MQTVNNYDLDVFNGDVGTVTSVSGGPSPAARSATVAFGGGRVRTLAGPALAALEPAWAATVHKAQGGEAPAVVLFLDGSPPSARAATRRLLYTAITRARSLVVVLATDDALAAIAGRGGDDGVRLTSLERRLAAAAAERGGGGEAEAAA
jgi:exodeoxyribonuclease V alpha subunit